SGDVRRGARHARHPVCLHRRLAATGCRLRDVSTARADPAGIHPDAQVASVGGPAMRASVAGRRRGSGIASPLVYRLQRWGVEAACLVLGFVLLVWTVAPIYNMWEIA